MNYFQEIDAWLTATLLATDDEEDTEQWFLRVKKEIKEKILESYRNGQKAGLPPKPLDKDTQDKSREPRSGKPKPWPPRASKRQ